MKFLQDILASRKAQACTVLVLLGLWGSEMGLSPLQLEGVQTALLAYVLGRAVHDHGIAKSIR